MNHPNPKILPLLHRLGGKDKNVKRPGRFDPAVLDSVRIAGPFSTGSVEGSGRGRGGTGMGADEFDGRRTPYGSYQSGGYDRGGRDWGKDRSNYEAGRRRRRSRSRSPEYRYAPRPRY